MDEEYLALMVELHKRQKRQGPGGEIETEKAINLGGIQPSERLQIADIGCGTGASTIQLARTLDAQITAIDFLPEFIDILKQNAEAEGLSHRVKTDVCSMEQLPFADDEFDVIWSDFDTRSMDTSGSRRKQAGRFGPETMRCRKDRVGVPLLEG